MIKNKFIILSSYKKFYAQVTSSCAHVTASLLLKGIINVQNARMHNARIVAAVVVVYVHRQTAAL